MQGGNYRGNTPHFSLERAVDLTGAHLDHDKALCQSRAAFGKLTRVSGYSPLRKEQFPTSRVSRTPVLRGEMLRKAPQKKTNTAQCLPCSRCHPSGSQCSSHTHQAALVAPPCCPKVTRSALLQARAHSMQHPGRAGCRKQQQQGTYGRCKHLCTPCARSRAGFS